MFHASGLQFPALSLQPSGPAEAEDDVEGMRGSLAEGKVFNATFYAQRLLEAGRFDDLERAVLEVASREVDPLGHVFIYTDCSLRLMRSCAPEARPEILLNLMEYLSRKADPRAPRLSEEKAPLDELVRQAAERIGVLGHNLIYARSLRLRRDDLPAEAFARARAQLARNIARSDEPLTAEQLEQMGAMVPSGLHATVLPQLVARGDVTDAVAAVRGYLAEGAAPESLLDDLLMALCRVKMQQPHYLIFPESVLLLLADAEDPCWEPALAQIARMACRAAREHGMARPDGP
jgi:hypothetical protein